ncbi:hypothetical protein RJZ56_001524 [Blastomyces dermatitidis]|uniref:Uncharacterized protein n=1 Tax=Blastomyces gilchristii (strain SLH14081) TaxID=559298 RepID=A0A179UR33_BLAGS|nr:uncharacterized protein BDBG_05417 [Blastomyces gilchristii SLH14081]XP_031578952.1 hypothetical protein, variant [Blastomyces gilchristii SLH14081]EQL32669.1 hypothetical protein BDFG_05210 [Blastomyces dermatitidis ATCC 26199]EQL32670.1 hypothetical protein, variant [Blastomyces dermatitidis ATCC 26199]OAT09679.1 hypothetical protein BDBG_05417 [Blastomyces gilchristii SLH14081]OAT09680.1 hypothetical protein, variant [Blastomyces gilchristii SLH14081]
MPATMSQSYQHILSPIPSKSTLVKGTGTDTDGTTTTTTGTTSTTKTTNNINGINASTFIQEISRAMQASSSQQPKYAAYPYLMDDGVEHPPPPPPSPVGWSRS